MCGIAGFVSVRAVAPSVTQAMLRAVESRGPDSRRCVTWDRSLRKGGAEVANALAVARLAIRDPRPEADQPMSNDQGDIWIAYNGEVYGWEQQARRLAQDGAAFHTASDTEFVLRAYERWGIGFLTSLRGMFAIALLDLRAKQLWLIRDRAGIKPLVYSHRDGDLAFGSTVRSVVPFLDRAQRDFSPEAIDAYLAHRYIPAPATVFRGIRRLENAHWLRMDLTDRRIEQRRFWVRGFSHASPAALLDEAISMRTVADRPMGIFLSAGVDSSCIAHRVAAAGRFDITTFTASFPGSQLDEGPTARETASRLGLSHVMVPMPTQVEAEFASVIADLDEPFADPSAFPTWYLCRRASETVKAVLVGDGLDELLAGYKRVPKHLGSAWRRQWNLSALPVPASRHAKGWTKWAAEAALPWEEAYSLRFSGFTPSQRRYLQPGFTPSRVTYWRMPDVAGRSALEALLEIDLENYLPEYILRKSDLCSMSHGLELRPPFLDHLWVETIAAMDPRERFAAPPKSVMQRIRPELAELQLFSRPKRGFNPPVGKWFDGASGPRLHGLGARLHELTQGQLDAAAVDAVCRDRKRNTEQLLQLVVLDESLAQLRRLD